MKVGFVTNIYTPYKEAMFREMAKLMELKVYYCAQIEKGREWDVAFSGTYDYTLLPGKTLNLGRYHLHCNPSLAREMIKDEIDIIIIGEYCYPTVMAAPFVAKSLGIPRILWSGSTALERKKRARLTDIVKRHLVKQYDGYVTYTTKAAEQLIYLGADSSKITVAPVTVDTDYFFQTSQDLLKGVGREAMRGIFGLKAEEIAICFVGQLIERKGLDLLIKAVDLLDNSKVRILAAGNGPMKAELIQLAESLGMGQRVSLLGQLKQEDLVKLYCASDIFCLPSRMDPSGNVINEAMTVGLPVIISDQVGADIVRHEIDGLIFKAEDVRGLADSIGRIAGDTALSEKMKRSGQRRATTEFSIQAEANQFKKAVESVFGERLESGMRGDEKAKVGTGI